MERKILFQREIFRHDRFLGQISVGTMPHDKVMRAVELSELRSRRLSPESSDAA